MYAADEFEHSAHVPGAQLQVVIEPLLLRHQVDLMIAGHAHA
jgi:hypothetical protein